MPTLLASSDILGESQRLISVLEERCAELPSAEYMLAMHRSTHHELENSHIISEQAVEAWRAALANRWECEVAGRRLYKQVLRQLINYCGNDAPEIQLLSQGQFEEHRSPSELLDDLRRVQLVLTLKTETLPFAHQRLTEIAHISSALSRTIDEVTDWERRRRMAVLDYRLAREAYRRICAQTRQVLADHYGDQANRALQEIFG